MLITFLVTVAQAGKVTSQIFCSHGKLVLRSIGAQVLQVVTL